MHVLNFVNIRILFSIFLFVFIPLTDSYAKEKDTSSVEWIKVFFNTESDHSVAFENNYSNDNWDMIQELVNLIDSAKFSIDLAAYDLQNMLVGQALANAARRGVQVRVITDVIHRNHAPRFVLPMWDTLRNAGIISFDDSGTIYWPNGDIDTLPKKLPNSGANMHHKFCVIDGYNEDPNDDFIWTGSMNITYTGPWNTNAILIIKDNGICESYLEEFNQMWGSKKMKPNPQFSLFHKTKRNVTNNKHFVGSIPVEVYFGPIDRDKTKPSISVRVTELINNYCLHDARFLAFAISSNVDISKALLDRSARGEIQLQGVIDPAFYSRYKNMGDVWASPESKFGNRYITAGKEVRKLHSKTLLLDATYPYPDKHHAVTITGSYNFSKAAENVNDENLLIIYSNEITNQFYQDFMGVMNRAKQKSFHSYPKLDTSFYYKNFRVIDAQTIEVELDTNFYYPVSLLGVNSPRKWVGHADSTEYFSNESHAYLSELLKNNEIQLKGVSDSLPEHWFGKYYAYVFCSDTAQKIFVNGEMIKTGHATFSLKSRHSEDSVIQFRKYAEEAQYQKIGMWKNMDSVGMIIQTPFAAKVQNLFPLNLNEATLEEIGLIPSIGPAKAKSIYDYIQENKGISSLEELENVKGIGPASIEKIKQYIRLDSSD